MLLIGQPLSYIISFAITAILAFAYHEFAHALVADRLGDPTPRANGRMTLNPIPHLSIFGLVMLFLLGFGWASTPVNPNQLRGNPRRSMMWVSLAGPAANLLMAIIYALPIRIGLVETSGFENGFPTLFNVLFVGVWINLLLMAFNLLPIPPLDGFTILVGLLPADLAYQIAALAQYGSFILLALLILPQITGFSIIGTVITPIITTFMGILTGLS